MTGLNVYPAICVLTQDLVYGQCKYTSASTVYSRTLTRCCVDGESYNHYACACGHQCALVAIALAEVSLSTGPEENNRPAYFC